MGGVSCVQVKLDPPGADSDQPFPPNRLDKVTVVELKPCSIKVMEPGDIEQAAASELKREEGQFLLKWSDHSGLVCPFAVD